MRYLFLVQGEGRGHMSQALALSEMLARNGDEIVHTFIGESIRREVPGYFINGMNSKVQKIHSPNFILDDQNKSLKLYRSVFYNALFLKTYYKSLQTIEKAVNKYRPDVLINFYDFLGGFYYRLFRPKIHHVVIGHAFLTGHPEFPLAKGRPFEKRLFMTNNLLTSMGAVKRIALSLRPLKPRTTGKTVVAPPLLRDKVLQLHTKNEPFLLAYMVNDGYAEELIEWHRRHPGTMIHCFWDRKGYNGIYDLDDNLRFHPLDEAIFLDHLSRCSGYATTAGFESVAEAFYLGKPVLTVPVKGQYEQACNALDAVHSGLAIKADKFDLSSLTRFLDKKPAASSNLKAWMGQAKDIILPELHNL